MNIVTICNVIIEYSFYSLFFFVPLVFAKDTSELFELNKMWLTFGLTIVIATAWIAKMILQKKFFIQKTPLDVPIILFLISQIISTVYSIDPHVSLWGYYSRFNGGLLSIFSYIILYYAFASNFTKDIAKKSIFFSLASAFLISIFGILSHFGHDPICLLFNYNQTYSLTDNLNLNFNVDCWTAAFQPEIRIFSTLGQPNWLAAYLSILLPIPLAMFLNHLPSLFKKEEKYHVSNIMYYVSNKTFLLNTCYILLTTVFYVAILFTGSRSGFFGLLSGLFIFFLLAKEKLNFLKYIILPLLIISIIVGTPFNGQIEQLAGKFLPKISAPQKQQTIKEAQEPAGPALETGGTESGTIRFIVWKGAIDVFLHYPIFGSGVETFAFSYYQYRPAAHNLTSEWDYLYNKAHNEYFNYLATTGTFGLGSYLLMIGTFLFISIKYCVSSINKEKHNTYYMLLATGLIAGYVSILASNFWGFSVVILNIYLFLIPALVFVLLDKLSPDGVFSFPSSAPNSKLQTPNPNIWQWLGIASLILAAFYLLLTLLNFWNADKNYAKGVNYGRAGEYQHSYLPLLDAVDGWKSEPTYQDELSYSSAALAVLLSSQTNSKDASGSTKIASYSAQLTQEALSISNNVVADHPNNISFWKTRVRMLYLLSEIDPAYLSLALDSIKHAQKLAPTDAKVSYSLGILYGQNNDTKKAIETLLQTIKLKPDYKDARYALGIFYHNLASDKNNHITDRVMQEKAVDAMQYILLHIASNDAQAKQALKTWEPL